MGECSDDKPDRCNWVGRRYLWKSFPKFERVLKERKLNLSHDDGHPIRKIYFPRQTLLVTIEKENV